MTWFRVDDSFGDHPKVKSIPRRRRAPAVGLWSLAGSYAARHLTNGVVLATDVPDFAASAQDADSLVQSGLWHEHGHDCRRCVPVEVGQYLYHDWLDFQPSRDKVLAERAKAAERQRKARERASSQRESQGQSRRDESVTHGGVTHAVTVPPTRPDPTPVVNELSEERSEPLGPPVGAEPICSRHPNGNGPDACGGCRARRLWMDRNEQTAKDAARNRREGCPDCHGTGWLEDEHKNPAGKCGHRRAS